MGNSVKKIWKQNKQVFKYIIILFVITRIILTMVGVFARITFENRYPGKNVWSYTNNVWLDIWGVWDSGFYLDIAKRGYSENQNFEFPVSISPGSFGPNQINFGFFPLYPILIKGLTLTTKDYFLSGIFISNMAFLVSAFVLYKLVSILKDESCARRSVKYLFLFPTSFILSGGFS